MPEQLKQMTPEHSPQCNEFVAKCQATRDAISLSYLPPFAQPKFEMGFGKTGTLGISLGVPVLVVIKAGTNRRSSRAIAATQQAHKDLEITLGLPLLTL
jgi:hypothetical protein